MLSVPPEPWRFPDVSESKEEQALGEIAGVDLSGPYHSLRVARVIDETRDARSIVLEIPDPLRDLFAYRAGQFLTFRFEVAGEKLVRCYSLASCPASESEHKVTIKRIADGRVSNWIHEALAAGHYVEVMRPAGLFTLRNRDRAVVLFGGGSGITPCISILKTALATTDRKVRLLYANRDEESVIFRDELRNLEERYPERLSVVHRYDVVHGFADEAAVREHVGADLDADFYVCGPAGFMDVVERTLLASGVSREHVFIERFGSPAGAKKPEVEVRSTTPGAGESRIEIVLGGKTHEIPWLAGETVLAAAKRAGLEPPFACEEGYCGCCMAKLVEGAVDLQSNDCLDRSQLAEGWILTCQGVPREGKVRVRYPD
jgi:3-ketosteroid 9alpha-monooxygenase subunit B